MHDIVDFTHHFDEVIKTPGFTVAIPNTILCKDRCLVTYTPLCSQGYIHQEFPLRLRRPILPQKGIMAAQLLKKTQRTNFPKGFYTCYVLPL